MSANVKYPTIRPKHANAAFLAVWLMLALYCYSNSYDDPSSIFFNEKLAFRERFSLVRTTNAEHLIEVLTYGPPTPKIERLPGTKPFLCIGVPSVARNTVSFLPQTLATLVDTLTDEERSTIHLVTLLADQDPKDHPAYEAPWLDRLVDEAIVYSAGNWTLPPQPEVPSRAPLPTTSAKPAAAGIADVEQRKASHPKAPDWLYFRLFYSEIFMGWNSEEWLGYSRVIFELYVLALVVFLVLRRTWPAASLGAQGKRTVTTYRHTSAWMAALVFGLWLPALIVLYFAAGRVSTHRMTPWSSDGVREMPNYGCCAQGLVFPQRHLDMIHDMLVTPPFNFPGDMMLEDLARDKQLTKWALEPSVFQHVGLKESSDGTQRKEVWNFSFERQQK
ncbi:integral membrane protein [Verticillium alfalfae VaMs.102]|uniref:Integral membrane protein n=1 Tax=Verticillium alfalfae (strain VaMs.102 / ATCC MYA-4576 / FGSC 10136) TaxID=526221 RepID=C9SN68_VERA1|nr:integral membrane protein [Verticillium alfalfae VaMs.102]EEY20233.1 integral membrane protein [Verticillium alfalfae VaMs.102]